MHPNRAVVVKAPMRTELGLIEKRVQKRARWIFKQLRYFEQFTPRTPPRQYLAGETHIYLGRQYRLKVEVGTEASVKLSRGHFHVTCVGSATPAVVRELMQRWYIERAHAQFVASFERCWPKFEPYNLVRPRLAIRLMRTRWGSLSSRGVMTLNTLLVKAPRECIDYVVMHELCHLKHHNHGAGFYRLLDSVFPDWKRVKHRLEACMA